MAHAQKIVPQYTYNDYIEWEGRWELIDGYPFAMSPMPVPKHQWVAAALKAEFIIAFKREKCKKCKVYEPLDYKIAEDTIVQPDMLIVCKPIKKKFLDFPPVLVAEILSPSTALKDRNSKFVKYQQEKIKYYLMVDIEKDLFELYELINEEYVLQEKDFNQPFTFSFDNDCSVEVVLNEVWG